MIINATLELNENDINAYASYHNYNENITDEEGNEILNPESKEQFVNNKIKNYLGDVIATQFIEIARKQMENTFQSEIGNITDIAKSKLSVTNN